MQSIIDNRFQCSICLNCLKNPMLTRCGHRFCSDCILAWLKRKSQSCPIDSESLSVESLFPDNYTKREIDEQTVSCSNDGCGVIIPLLEADDHFSTCKFSKIKINGVNENICPFNSIGCEVFFNTEKELLNHLELNSLRHLNLLSKSHLELLKKIRLKEEVQYKTLEATQFWDANKDPNSEKALLCNLFERIVVLEQSSIEKDKDIKRLIKNNNENNKNIEQLKELVNNLSLELSQSQNILSLAICNGVYVWRFEHFMESFKLMKEKPLNTRFYTPGFYTSSTGYKVCGRMNMSLDNQNLSLFIHMMRGDYDDTLVWPFTGHITLSLIHPTDSAKTVCLKMESSAESEAFRRCSFGNGNETPPLNPRAFGYSEFVAIEEVLHHGFLKDDTIVIKIIVECI